MPTPEKIIVVTELSEDGVIVIDPNQAVKPEELSEEQQKVLQRLNSLPRFDDLSAKDKQEHFDRLAQRDAEIDEELAAAIRVSLEEQPVDQLQQAGCQPGVSNSSYRYASP